MGGNVPHYIHDFRASVRAGAFSHSSSIINFFGEIQLQTHGEKLNTAHFASLPIITINQGEFVLCFLMWISKSQMVL